MDITVIELIPVLQTAIGPVALISGIGLLILSMTNRLGRVIDRGRSLAAVGMVIAFRFLIDWNRQYRELWLDREQPS